MKYAKLFADQIKLLEKQVRTFRIAGNSLLIGGVALMVYAARRFDTGEALKLAMGFLTSGASVAFFKEIHPKQERIVSYTYMKSEYEASEGWTQEKQQQLDELAKVALEDMMKR